MKMILLLCVFLSFSAQAQDEFPVEHIEWHGEFPVALDIAEYEEHSVATLFAVGQALANRGQFAAVGIGVDAGAGSVWYDGNLRKTWTPLAAAQYSDMHIVNAGTHFSHSSETSTLQVTTVLGHTDMIHRVGPWVHIALASTFDISDGARYVALDVTSTVLKNTTEIKSTVSLPFTGIRNQASFALGGSYFSGTTSLFQEDSQVLDNNRLRLFGQYSHRVNNRGNFYFSAIGGVQTSPQKTPQFLDDHMFVGALFSSVSPTLETSTTLTDGFRKDSIVTGSGGSAFIGTSVPLIDSVHSGLFYVSGSMFSATSFDNVYAAGSIQAGTGFADGAAQFIALVSRGVANLRMDPFVAQVQLQQVTTWSWDAFRQVAPDPSKLRGYDYRSAIGENLVNTSVTLSCEITTGVFAQAFVDAAAVWNRGEQLTEQKVHVALGPQVSLHAPLLGFWTDLSVGAAYRGIDKQWSAFVHTGIPLLEMLNIARSNFPFLESQSLQY